MNTAPDQIIALNAQLETLLIEDDVDWEPFMQLVERRDKLLEAHLDDADKKDMGSTDSELKSIVKSSLTLNKVIASQMKAEQHEAEQALLKVNQGKKARASYE